MLDDIQMKEISEHLKCCSACRQNYEILTANIGLLKNIPEISLPSDFDFKLNAALHQARKKMPIFKKINWKAYSIAAAVFLLMITSVSVNLLNQKNDLTHQIKNAGQIPEAGSQNTAEAKDKRATESAALTSNVIYDKTGKNAQSQTKKLPESDNSPDTSSEPPEHAELYKAEASAENVDEQKYLGFSALTRGNISVKNPDEMRLAADCKMDIYTLGINESNADYLLQCMTQEQINYYGSERAKAALSDYKAFFGNESVMYEFIDYDADNNCYKYLIKTASAQKEASIVFVDDNAYVNELCLTYSYWVHNKVNNFIEALKKKDTKKLAAALCEDDLYCSESEAQKVLKIYSDAFDLNTLSYSFEGFSDNDSFLYSIKGKRNSADVSHSIYIVCGDGLAAIRDEWAKVKLEPLH